MEIVQDIMLTIIDLDLFSQSNGRVFCVKLIKRINLSQTSNAKFREAIARKKEEYMNEITHNHDAVMIDHDAVMTNHDLVTTRHEYLPTNQHTNQPTAQKTKKTKEPEKVHGKYENVILTDDQRMKLQERLGKDPSGLIDFFSEKKSMHGYKYKSDYAAICNWGIDAYQKTQPLTNPSPPPKILCTCGGEYNRMGFCKLCSAEKPYAITSQNAIG